MKMKRFWLLGMALAVLCSGTIWFGISSYGEIKSIEEREQYLDSLDWVLEVGDYVSFSQVEYGNENLFCYQYEKHSSGNTQGMITPSGKWIVPCEYDEIYYNGGDYFAALSDESWYIFDFDGREIAKIFRDDEHLYYAGGAYFFYYPDFQKMGFAIMDACTGEVVQAFPEGYSGYWIGDGTWYISETPRTSETIGFDRVILDAVTYREHGRNYFEDTQQMEGYFLDAQFQPLYGKDKYVLVLCGDGCVIADRVVDGIVGDRVFLDQNGEQLVIGKNTSLYATTEVIRLDQGVTYGLVVDDDGNIGLTDQSGEDNEEKIHYYGRDGWAVYEESTRKHDLVVNYNEEGLYQIMDADKNILLRPYFSSIEILGNGDYAEVYVSGSGKHGIIDLRGLM